MKFFFYKFINFNNFNYNCRNFVIDRVYIQDKRHYSRAIQRHTTSEICVCMADTSQDHPLGTPEYISHRSFWRYYYWLLNSYFYRILIFLCIFISGTFISIPLLNLVAYYFHIPLECNLRNLRRHHHKNYRNLLRNLLLSNNLHRIHPRYLDKNDCLLVLRNYN